MAKQRNKYVEERKMQITKHADKILHSAKKKNAKLSKNDPKYIPESELTIDKVIENKLKNIKNPKPGSLLVQIHLEYPFINDLKWEHVTWDFPKTDKDKIRYAVYKNLWSTNENYYVMCGRDSGMDFMLYKGDPLLVHAVLGVIVGPSKCKHSKDFNSEFSNTDVLTTKVPGICVYVHKKKAVDCRESLADCSVLSSASSAATSNESELHRPFPSSNISNASKLQSPSSTSSCISEKVGAAACFQEPFNNSRLGISVQNMIGFVRVNNYENRKTLLAFVEADMETVHYQTIKWEGNQFGGLNSFQ